MGFAVPRKLSLIKIDFGFSVAPVAAILQKGRHKLSAQRAGKAQEHQRYANAWRHSLEAATARAERPLGTSMDTSDSESALNDETEANRVGMIDLMAHDPKTDETVLVMNEATVWDGSNEQLHRLQERFN